MGFFHVNGENYSAAAVLPKSVWTILITIGFFLIWLDYPTTIPQVKKYSLIIGGILLLALMAFLFKGGDTASPHWMQPEWWGILGIIGRAYLVCATIFLLTKGNLSMLLVSLAVFILINVTKHLGLIDLQLVVIGDASSVTLVMTGITIAGIYE